MPLPRPAPSPVIARTPRPPPIEAAAAAGLARNLPEDPAAIEAFVDSYVPYKTAWALYGLPWYFPTVAQVVADRGGDCQARAILTASIFRAKGLPYTFHYSFDHVWVDWPGKQATRLDDPATAFASDSGKGWLAGLPDKIPLRAIVEERLAYHWDPMSLSRKLFMLAGVLLALLWGELLLTPVSRSAGRAGRWPARRPAPGTEPSAPA